MQPCKKVLEHRLKANLSTDKLGMFYGELHFKIINNKIDKLWINGISQKMVV